MTEVLQPTRPLGKGWYVRDSMATSQGISAADIALLKGIGVNFAAVNVSHPVTIKRLQSAGIWAWVFGLPSAWGPSTWRTALARSLAVCAETGAARIWADPENGWPGASPEEWTALGAALGEVSRRGIQVCVTTHGGLRSRVAKYVAPYIARHGGIISPQLYDHSRGASLTYAADGVPLWTRTMSGCQIVPSIGVLSTGPEGSGQYSDARYRGVFAQYPRAWNAAIVWPENDPTQYQRAVLAAWKVGYAPEI